MGHEIVGDVIAAERPFLAPSCRAERRDKRRLAAELRPKPASGDIRAGFARCGLFR